MTWMMHADLRVEATKASDLLFTLTIFDGESRVGEYERSSEAQIDRKKGEIQRVADLLRWVHATFGPFEVRWSGVERRKEVRVAGRVVTIIPRACWGDARGADNDES